MAQPFLGQITIAGFGFPAKSYATANGALLPIRQNTNLFSLIGAMYGGNGATTFALPNLASRAVCCAGQGPGLTPREVGDEFGELAVSLGIDEMPAHIHTVQAYVGRSVTPSAIPTAASGLSQTSSITPYNTDGKLDTPMSTQAITTAGGGLPHENRQPFLAVNYMIALSGAFPSFG